MGYLRRFARKVRPGEKTAVVTARLPENLYREFKEYVEGLGLTISEGIYLLVDREMKEKDEQATNTLHTNTRVYKPRPHRTAGGGPRGVVAPFIVGGRVPCPLCRTWQSRANISRHMKDLHDTTTEEAYTAYKDIVEQMVKEARGENGEE